MQYGFKEIEKKWQNFWKEQKTFKTDVKPDVPKYYVLDMFPYPSGAGLHVGHPLGYIASDIFARYKKLKGFNVLHPMGFDSFGLPAEQYAIQTGQHPAITTEQNIQRYREQLGKMGFSYDWDREVRTSDPSYYKWTQWIFGLLFNAWYNHSNKKAEDISTLIAHFENNGNQNIHAATDIEQVFSASEWASFSTKQQQEILLQYRLAYRSESEVNWCPELGTVLANDEVKDGLSERGGYPVIRKKMMQWSLRISAYADRLLQDLDDLDWSESIKEIQRNWIGKSVGASIHFDIQDSEHQLEVFTTRPDTIFGATFMVIAPEHELTLKICSEQQREEVEAYIEATLKKSERDRISEVKKVSGAFTGAHAIHPITGDSIPIWTSEYVIASYGTGAIMAVPGGDERDWNFAKHFDLPIIQVVEDKELTGFNDSKEGKMINSSMLNGLSVADATVKILQELEEKNRGKKHINFRMRDAIFGRQRYWGEPISVYYKDGIPELLPLDKLPLELPEVDKFLPTSEGEPPLARAKQWSTDEGFPLEQTTMPSWAGSSWYFYRYMDNSNTKEAYSAEKVNYWKNVDFYMGGAEHATGHLLYARFWAKFLYDLGLAPEKEPFQKMVNQGMIQGNSKFVYKVKNENTYVSKGLKHEYDVQKLHVDVNITSGNELDVLKFKSSNPEHANAEFILENGKYICGSEVEKMSKSKFNVVNPDVLIEKYGADTLRCYEMFLGPIEQHKPWDTNGIEGVHKFLKKLWSLFYNENGLNINSDEPSEAELKLLHKTIKKVGEDIERLSFNTVVSELMILTNELIKMDCHKRSILEPIVVLLSPYAPHLSEELWQALGHEQSVYHAAFPEFNEAFLEEDAFNYPIQINGKKRFMLNIPLDWQEDRIKEAVLTHDDAQKWIGDQPLRKFIVVPGRIINVVV